MSLLFLLILALALLCLLAPFLVAPADRFLNRTRRRPSTVPPGARALHDSLWIADFHNDALLWNRDLLARHTRGQVDLPRLNEGRVKLAVFAAATRFHIASNYARTPPVLDLLPPVAVASRWPRRAWFDPYERALAMSRKLREQADASAGGLRLVTSRDEVDALLRDQASGDPVVGAVLLLEGLHAAGGDPARVDSLFSAGYRIFGIAHMFDNDAGGSAHGWNKTGLTPLGRRMIARIDALGAIIDLSHASRATIEDVLSLTSRPLLVSHTGLTSSCSSRRNIPDDVVGHIASRGGMIGIGFWTQAVCGDDGAAIARAMHRAIDVAGDEHVALGSDFDGGVATPFDVAHMAVLTSALIDRGLDPERIRRVMGENQKAFLRANLPAR